MPAYVMRISDWSSDVCSSDLRLAPGPTTVPGARSSNNGKRRSLGRDDNLSGDNLAVQRSTRLSLLHRETTLQGLPAMLAVNPELFAGFIVAVVVLILMPGPIVTLVVANSLAHGQRIGLATVAGSSSGNAVLVAAGALGLTTLLALAAELFEVLRWAGVAYLVYLGVKQWRQAFTAGKMAEMPAMRSRRGVFWQGALVAITNQLGRAHV